MLLLALLAAAPFQFPSPINLGAPPPGVELLQITAPANVSGWAEPAPVGDINADGFDDFAFRNYNYTSTLSNRGIVYVVFGQAGLASTAQLSLGQLNGANGFVMLGSAAGERLGFDVAAAGDVNGDGIDDLLIAASLVANASGVRSPGAYVLFGSPQLGSSGSILSNSIVPPLGFRIAQGNSANYLYSHVAGPGDMDGDGYDDVVVADPDDGERQVEYPLGVWDESRIAAGDIDNDGDVDIVGTSGNTGYFKIFYNDGNGGFTAIQFPLSGWLNDVEIHDLDNDGWSDLLFARTTGPQQGARLTIRRNQQNGLFGPAQDYQFTDSDLTFDVADINGDGFADVVAADFTFSSSMSTFQRVVPYLNDGTGALVAGTPTQLPGEPRQLKVGDVDGDGDMDVVVSCHATQSIWPLAGDGSGSFVLSGPLGGYPALGVTEEFELGDLDGDGDLDLVCQGIRTFMNSSGLTFGPAIHTQSNLSGHAIELADFDGDGDLDAMATQHAMSVPDEVALLCNDGNGTFAARRYISSELSCRQDIVSADLDGDGDLDAAVVGYEAGQQWFMVLINRGGGAFGGPQAGQVGVIRGGPTASLPELVDLEQSNLGRSLLIPGPYAAARLGTNMSGCGDVNGDGFADFVAQLGRGYSHKWRPGTLVVVLGGSGLFSSASLDLLALDGVNGFELRTTVDPGSIVGSFGGPGDFDGDGFDDLTFGGGGSSSGSSPSYPASAYVLFGGPTVGAGGLIAPLQPDGVTLVQFQSDQLNDSMASDGLVLADINADGRDDLVSSADAYDEQLTNRGAVRCIYGAPRPWPATPVVVSGLDGSWGFRVLGPIANGYTGGALSAAGDVDGDGVEDLLIQDGGFSSGSLIDRAFLLFGQSNGTPQPYCQAKVNSLGCTPQVGWAGQLPSVSDSDPFFVTASNLLNQKPGILYYGLAGRTTAPFQGGTLCVRQPVRRTFVQSSGGSATGIDCSGTFSFDWSAWMDSGSDPNLGAGTVVDAQFWSRDPAASFTSSLTGGLEFEIGL